MNKRHKIPFPRLTGFIAAHPQAFGREFDVLEKNGGYQANEASPVAVLTICGPLVQHPTFMVKDGMLLFPPSYDEIRASALAAFTSDAKVVVLRIDSPGGDFSGSLELARDLRRMSQETGKPLLAFTDTQAASAAYALACAADHICITPSAQVGSVGVWAMLQEETAADRAKGLNIAVVASGARKADRNPHVPMTEGTVSALQVEVDLMAGMFFDAVGELRGLGRAKVEALEGAQRIGEDAVRAGLADTLSNSWEDFVVTATATEGKKPMAMSYEKARAAHRANLASLAAQDDDDGKAAAAEIAEMDKNSAKAAKKAEAEGGEDKEEKSAKAEGDDKEEPKAKAADEGDDKEKARAASGGVSFQASGGDTLALAKAVQELRAEISATKAQAAREKEEIAKERLLATRADFGAEIKASLMSLSVSKVEDAVKNWPKVQGLTGEASVNFTRGDGQITKSLSNAEYADKETVEDFIDRKMQFGAIATPGIVHKSGGHTVELGHMTREQAAKRLAALAALTDKEVK